MFIRTLLVASISQVLGFAAMAGDVPLIPRETLFGNPERANVQISPDGTQISYLAPLDGVLNVWVMPVSGGEAAAITKSMDRPIRSYGWSWNNEQILYEQDKGGNEDTHIYAVNLADGKTTDLTPGDGVKAAPLRPARLMKPMTGQPSEPAQPAGSRPPPHTLPAWPPARQPCASPERGPDRPRRSASARSPTCLQEWRERRRCCRPAGFHGRAGRRSRCRSTGRK